MFEESLVESTALLQTRNRWPALLSFAAQAVLAITILTVPMLHPELLPTHAPAFTLTSPPPPRPPKTPPPPQHLRAEVAASITASAPAAPPAQRSFLRTLLPAAPSTVDTPIATNLGPGMTENTTGIPGIGVSLANTPNAPVVSAIPPPHAGPISVSAGVTAGLLLAPIRPDYPAIAKSAHLEGTVIVRAIISRMGQIEKAQVISGSSMLANAALEAVERARYRPYLLDGQPTEVETTVTVNFRLGT